MNAGTNRTGRNGYSICLFETGAGVINKSVFEFQCDSCSDSTWEAGLLAGKAVPFTKQTCPLQGTAETCGSLKPAGAEGANWVIGLVWRAVNKWLPEMETKEEGKQIRQPDVQCHRVLPSSLASPDCWFCFTMFASVLRLGFLCLLNKWVFTGLNYYEQRVSIDWLLNS